jgi:hypothetical protein
MRYSSVESTLLMVGVVCLAGCTTSSSVKGAWQQSTPNRSYSRILLVGISTNFDQRCSFEFSMASQFSGSSTVPLVSCNTMMPKEPLTRQNIEQLVVSQHADAVLTTAVVTMQMAKGQGYTGMPYYQVEGVGYVTGPVGAYGVPVAFVQLETPPHIPTITGDIHLITKLFDTHDATLVYTLDTRAKTDDLQSDPVATDTITAIIAARLRHDGVIH